MRAQMLQLTVTHGYTDTDVSTAALPLSPASGRYDRAWICSFYRLPLPRLLHDVSPNSTGLAVECQRAIRR